MNAPYTNVNTHTHSLMHECTNMHTHTLTHMHTRTRTHTHTHTHTCRLQTSIDYTYTAQFLAWVGYPLLNRRELASALTGMLHMIIVFVLAHVWCKVVLVCLSFQRCI